MMVFLLHVGRLPLAISRILSRNRILYEAAYRMAPAPTPTFVRFYTLVFSLIMVYLKLNGK